MTLRRLHCFSALFLTAFAALHLANHLVGLAGVEPHIAFTQSLRVVYRQPVVEALLIAAVVLQIYSGTTFVVRGWKQRHGFMPWLQAGSGAYLAFFLLNHVGAVLLGRAVFKLDTNFYFAAAGFQITPFQFFFAPYYFLGVLALFTHLGCALYWHLQTQSRSARLLAVALPVAIGATLSLLIVMMLVGALYPVQVPLEYTAPFGALR